MDNKLPAALHEPYVVAWMFDEGVAKHAEYDFVWVVEDDARFKGDVGGFYANFEDDDADFISCFQAAGVGKDWPHANKHVHWALDNRTSLHHSEHVVRYSRRLLFALDALLGMGVVAYGEIFASSICREEAWCHAEALNGYTSAHNYNWRSRVTPNQWDSGDLETGKWYHALKAMKGPGNCEGAFTATAAATRPPNSTAVSIPADLWRAWCVAPAASG